MEEPGWSQQANSIVSRKDSEASELKAIRTRIDELDQLTAQLLTERLKLARQLTSIKTILGLPIQDTQREQEVLSHISSSTSDVEIANAIKIVYERIIEQSCKLQSCQYTTSAKTKAGLGHSQIVTTQAIKPTRKPIYFPRVHIIGLGLIGGALARLIKQSIPQTIISAEDKKEILDKALCEGVIDIAETKSSQALKRASLVILAASPETNLSLLEELAPHLHRRQLVIDVTSTKGKICELSQRLNLNGADFIGGHPLFGSEKSGFLDSSAINPEGTTFCLVPTKNSSEMALRRLCRWLLMLNLKVKVVDAATHDALAAKLSHIVQLLAVALGADLAEGISDSQLSEILSLSGTSFKQISRLMASPSQLWIEIIGQNRTQLKFALKEISQRLNSIIEAVESGNNTQLDKLFQLASRIPRCWS